MNKIPSKETLIDTNGSTTKKSKIASLSRETAIFIDKPHLRLLREIWSYWENNTQPSIGSKLILTKMYDIQYAYKRSIVNNARRIVALKKENNKYNELDKEAYKDKIELNYNRIIRISNANKSIKSLVQQIDNCIINLASSNSQTYNSGLKFANDISELMNTKRALVSISKNEETMAFINPPKIESSEQFVEILKSMGIGDVKQSLEEMMTILEDNSKLLLTQLEVIKEFVKSNSEDDYSLIENIVSKDKPTVTEVVAFAKQFQKFYVSIRENEDFIKIEGLTPELAISMNSIISTSNLLGTVGMGELNDETLELMNNIAESSVDIEKEKIVIIFNESKKIIEKVFKEKDITEERKDSLHYILLIGIIELFELHGGIMALNLIDKI